MAVTSREAEQCPVASIDTDVEDLVGVAEPLFLSAPAEDSSAGAFGLAESYSWRIHEAIQLNLAEGI